MGVCHHIDWSGLQILIDTKDGRDNLKYKCLLCKKIMNEKEYKQLIKEIKQHKKDNNLSTWRTPKGDLHIKEECPDIEKCEIHGR